MWPAVTWRRCTRSSTWLWGAGVISLIWSNTSLTKRDCRSEKCNLLCAAVSKRRERLVTQRMFARHRAMESAYLKLLEYTEQKEELLEKTSMADVIQAIN